MESTHAIVYGQPPPVLSEQQLVDCNQGCDRGYMDKAFEWVIRHHGITTAAAYPYTGRVGQCRLGMPVAVRIYHYITLPPGDEEAIMWAVSRQPVVVGFDFSDHCFQHYTRGVYDAGCSMNGVYTGKGCQSSELTQNHTLTIVGYGTKYWIAKNSWGASWGGKGFVYLLRDSPPNGVCGLVLHGYYPVIS